MKRSEMVELIAKTMEDCLDGDNGSWELDAEKVLKAMEDAGMQPPIVHGLYDTVPTLTPTGNLEYSYKREWEQE